MKRILALDGGGIRGLFTACILAEMEKRSRKRIYEMFDLVAGVSTGGVLATMLACPNVIDKKEDCGYRLRIGGYTASDLVEFYQKEGPSIFSAGLGRKILSVGGVLRNRYSSKALKTALDKYMPNVKLSDTRIPIIVSAYDVGNNCPYFFKTRKALDTDREDYFLSDVALATSSAPTYFDPAKAQPLYPHEGPRYLIDGGIFGTNPAMHAYAEAGRLWPGEETFMLSIGTGRFWGPFDAKRFFNAGQAQWVAPLLDMMLQGGSETVDYQLNWRGGGYCRLQRTMTKASSEMDDASEKNLEALLWEAELAILNEGPALDSALAVLTSPLGSDTIITDGQ